MRDFFRKAAKYKMLTCQQRVTLWEAIFALYLFKVLCLCLPFSLVRVIGRRLAKLRLLSGMSVESNDTSMIKVAINQARHLIIWKRSYCLVNALAAQWMLTRRRIPAVIHLGVAKNHSKLSAHAWVVSFGKTVVGGGSQDEHTVVAALE